MIESRFRRCSHWSGEVGHQALRARVGQHAKDLPFEHLGLAQLATLGQVEQLVVGDAAPEKERQPRGELDIRDSVGGLRRDAGRVCLDPEEELRVDQDGAQGHFDSRVETFLGPGTRDTAPSAS